MVTGAVRAMSDRHPELSVSVLRTGWADQVEVLHDGRADVGYVRLPVDTRELRTEPLLTEPRVVVLPDGHRLAGKDSVHLADETLLQDPAAVPEWPRPVAAPAAWTVEEKLENVAAGRGIVVLPLSTARFYTRPDVTFAHIDDIADNQVCLAWHSARREPLIGEFVAVALEHRDSVAG
jgi:DNA-binding transcriptional LysR family regulator